MTARVKILMFFFFDDPAVTEIYTLSLHDALPICARLGADPLDRPARGSGAALQLPLDRGRPAGVAGRSEEHTSELQSRRDLVCRLLLEKKKERHDNTRQDRNAPIYRVTILPLRAI